MSSNDVANLPAFPGEDFYSHAASAYREQVEARLAELGWLAAAQGLQSEAVKAIVDIDLTRLPELDPADRDYNRRLETRIKLEAQNEANRQRRCAIQLSEWTKIYAALKKSTETSAPVLSRELQERCDLSKRSPPVAGGYFDGPRAWRMVLHKLSMGGERSQQDKNFYRASEHTQRSNRLPDGCSAADYAKKALAFLVHIKPNLPQTYSDDDPDQVH